mmetsp:Transcript_147260/g.257258  ORF Transcript_147260/g.257258 Transcript_147260/m.257258 type:complete len:93 (-) Transcript_147260:4012-4290(-)
MRAIGHGSYPDPNPNPDPDPVLSYSDDMPPHDQDGLWTLPQTADFPPTTDNKEITTNRGVEHTAWCVLTAPSVPVLMMLMGWYGLCERVTGH